MPVTSAHAVAIVSFHARCTVAKPPEPEERVPGWCVRCGFFFDIYGMRILDPTVKCKVHSPIKASCPHSGSLSSDQAS